MPPKAKAPVKVCRQIVRTIEGIREPCGIEYTGELCPERQDHLNVLKSGYCSNGWCEGTKAKTWRGDPAPTCIFWENCPCLCHDVVSQMFETAGMERIPVESSGYVPDHGGFWMPTDEDRARWAAEKVARSNVSGPNAPVVLESPAPGIVPASVARTFKPTASGRTARGELETWINRICGAWVVEKYPWPCTPVYISDRVAIEEGIPNPSTGAVSSVLNKWEILGYAVIARKPIRFMGYTEDGIRLGLEAMKDKVKRTKAAKRSAMERGIR